MKKFILTAALIALALLGVSCSGPTVPDAPPRDTTYLLPKILSFTVKPAEIQSGDIVYLSFAIESSTSCAVSINRNYTDKWGSTLFASWNPAPPGIDNLHEYLTKTTTYTLTATNREGSVAATRTVIVK